MYYQLSKHTEPKFDFNTDNPEMIVKALSLIVKPDIYDHLLSLDSKPIDKIQSMILAMGDQDISFNQYRSFDEYIHFEVQGLNQ